MTNSLPIAEAIENLTDTFDVSRGFREDSLPGAFTCGEAVAFADLLSALGLHDHAADFLSAHYYAPGEDEEDRENHEADPRISWARVGFKTDPLDDETKEV